MNYIKLIFITLLLSSCATTETTRSLPIETISTGASTFEQTEFERAIVLLNHNKLEPAKEIFQQFTIDRPELAGPYANLAIIALKNNKPERALELVNRALAKNPKLAQALNLLAYLEQVTGKIILAEKHYKQAIESKNDYAIAHYNLALLYDVYLQDIEKAIPHYEAYMKLINNKDKTTADWLEQIKRKVDNG